MYCGHILVKPPLYVRQCSLNKTPDSNDLNHVLVWINWLHLSLVISHNLVFSEKGYEDQERFVEKKTV